MRARGGRLPGAHLPGGGLARGERGLGGGDIKYLAAVMVAHPFAGAASFACGLAALAAAAAATRRRALPLLPFCVPAFLALLAVGAMRAR